MVKVKSASLEKGLHNQKKGIKTMEKFYSVTKGNQFIMETKDYAEADKKRKELGGNAVVSWNEDQKHSEYAMKIKKAQEEKDKAHKANAKKATPKKREADIYAEYAENRRLDEDYYGSDLYFEDGYEARRMDY